MPGPVETKDLAQLRQLNLELLRQLWVRQDAMRRSVAKAASESSPDSSSTCDSEMSLAPKTPSVAQRTSSPRDANEGDSCDVSSLGGPSSGVTSLPTVREPLSPPRPCVAPLLATSDSNDSERSTELEAQAPRSIRDQQRKLPELRVTFNKESPVPERSWRLRPYLGYDWIAGSLDNRSPISSKPEAFFSELQEFRETNKEECIHSEPEPQFPGRRESDSAPEDHECVYCYRVNRRLFLVPSDPGAPCRLCRTPRDQRGPKTLADPAQVRVSIPQSILDPPHRYPHPPAEELRRLRHAGPAPALSAGLGHSPSKIREKLRPPEPGPLVLCHLRGSAPAAVDRPFPPGPASAGPDPHLDLVRTPGAPAPAAYPGGQPEDWPLGGQCSHRRLKPLPSGRSAHERGALPGLS